MKSDKKYSKLFRLLDGYAKRHHECFLAELFLNAQETEYILCFRSQKMSEDPESRWACQYITVGLAEALEMIRTGLIPESVANILDEKLQLLAPNRSP